jgi:hypothetical protein
LLLPSALTRAAHAESKVQLGYDAPAECPAQADFEAAVANRGGRFDAREPAARWRRIDVSIHKGAQGFAGSLKLDAREGAPTVREVHAEQCSEVATGLSVVAAIALGGGPGQAPSASEPVPESSKPPAEPAVTPPKLSKAPTPHAKPDAKPRFVGSSFKREAAVEVPAGTLRFDRVRHYSVSAGADFGLLPGLVLPRYQLATSLANWVTPPATGGYLVGPILEAYWAFLGPGTVHHQGFTTRALGMQAGIHPCSALTYDTEGFTLLACAEFGVGWLKQETKDALGNTAQSKETGFGSAGLLLDSQYHFGPLFLASLRLGGRMQLGGLSAERADGTQIFGTQLFGAHAELGLGLQF